MPVFSPTSLAKLETCHADLVVLFKKVVRTRDCIVIEGHRGQELQNEYFRVGKSELKFPQSKHNKFPGMAVDVMQYFPDRPHLHWTDMEGAISFADFVLDVAQNLLARADMTHHLRWGGDWNMNGLPVNLDPSEGFWDAPHFELVTDVERDTMKSRKGD